MNFASYGFIAFLAVTTLLHYTLFRKLQWQLLLAASVVFYFYSGAWNLIFIAATVITTYIAARLIDKIPKKNANRPKRRRIMVICLAVNLGILAVTRYGAFAVSNVNTLFGAGFELPNFIIPLGISFYTFQTMSYLIDVYRGKEAEKNPFRFALFAMFFPQLIQGPISRYSDLAESLYGPHKFDAAVFAAGLNRIFIGFFKTIVIANRLIPVVADLTGAGIVGLGGLGAAAEERVYYYGANVLLAIFLYSITIFTNFTGGIDITIGIAKALGITVKENFDRPFYSRNIAEFWRRWHITMGTWFKDYLFFPMSTSKPMLGFMRFVKRTCGEYWGRRAPVYVCTLFLWFMTGLWHGATWNFVAWGLANGIVIVISQEMQPLFAKFNKRFKTEGKAFWNTAAIFRTFWLMNFIRAFDIFPGVGGTFRAFGSIVARPGLSRFSLYAAGLTWQECVMLAFAVLALILTGVFSRRLSGQGREPKVFTRYVCMACLALAIAVFGAYGPGFDATQFIYQQFT